MAKFVYLYTGGGMAETPEAQEQTLQVWGAWFGALGDAVLEIGNPFGAAASIAADGAVSTGSTAGATGYSVIRADSLDEATTKAKDCPVLASGGAVEVLEAIEM
jgi:hypothetical protein